MDEARHFSEMFSELLNLLDALAREALDISSIQEHFDYVVAELIALRNVYRLHTFETTEWKRLKQLLAMRSKPAALAHLAAFCRDALLVDLQQVPDMI